MSSDLFAFENALFSDPFSPFTELPVDPLPEEIEGSNQLNDGHLENLWLSQFRNAEKREFDLNFDGFSGLTILAPDIDETAVRLMRRASSSNSLENRHSSSRFNYALEPQFFQNQASTIGGGFSFSSGIHMRKLRMTVDLQNATTNLQYSRRSPPLMVEANFKVGRYSAEERKERIDRYRAKRNHRNFNKTIKYVCRKTLADNRPRLRGRFAPHHKAAEIPTASSST